MSSFDDEFSEEGGFGDWLSGLRPGHKVSLGGSLRYRQGSDPKDWSQPGGSKYLPREWQMQVGAQKWTGGARKSAGFEINFPVAFADPPVVLVSCSNTTPLFEEVRFQVTFQSAATVEVYWWSTNNLTLVSVSWLAIGPIGM